MNAISIHKALKKSCTKTFAIKRHSSDGSL